MQIESRQHCNFISCHIANSRSTQLKETVLIAKTVTLKLLI